MGRQVTMEKKAQNIYKSAVEAVGRSIKGQQERINEINQQIEYFERTIKGLRRTTTMIECDIKLTEQIRYDLQRAGILDGIYSAPMLQALDPQLFIP
jgi:prefoldin subunit 5